MLSLFRRFVLAAASLGGVAISAAQTGVPVIVQIADREVTVRSQTRQEMPQFLALQATNSPTSYAATGIPPPLLFNPSAGFAGFSWYDSQLSGGAFTVRVTATNAVGTSAPMTFRWIIHPSMMDWVRTDKPAYQAGDVITFTAKFSAPVLVTGSPYFQLWGNKKAIYAAGSGTSTLTFTYQVAADDAPLTGYYVNRITPGNGSITTVDGVSANLYMGGISYQQPPTFSIVGPPVPVVSNVTINAQVGTPVPSMQLQATNSPTSFTAASSLGSYGLSLSATGVIGGTPTQVASGVTISYTAANVTGSSAPGTITLNIAPPPVAPPPVTALPPPPPPPPVTSTPPARTNQTITFTSPVSAIVVGQPIALGATSSAGLPITYAIIGGDATLNGNVLTPASTAALVVRASSAGSDTVNSAFADVNFGNPQKANQTITFSSPVSAIAVGQPIALGATSSAGLPITYTIVSGDATVSGNVLTPTSAAPLMVRASSAGSDTVNAALVDVNFGSPQKTVQAITLTTSGGTVPAEKAIALRATASSGLPISYSVVSGPAALSGNTLTFTGTGVVTVRASQAGDGTFAAASDVMLTFTANPVDRLVNLSSRLRVGADANHTAVIGFVVTGDALKPVLIRAIGPGLAAFGVRGSAAEPQLQLMDSGGHVIATNAGWNNDAQISAASARVGAFALSPGAKDAALFVSLAPGPYTVQVTASGGGDALVEVYDALASAAVPAKQLINISTRGYVDAGGSMIGGFVVSGAETKRVLIRAIGGGLSAFGVSGALADPSIQVYDGSGVLVAQNDNWEIPQPIPAEPGPASAAQIAAAGSAAGAFALQAGARDAAVVLTLKPGSYTAVVAGANGASGAALVEIYEVNTP